MDNEQKQKQELVRELVELRRQIEACREETAAQKEFYQNLIHNSATPTFVVDSDHRVLLWNRACEKLTGIKAEDIVGTDEQWKPFYTEQRPVLADVLIDAAGQDLPALYSRHAQSPFNPEGIKAEGWFDIGGVQRYLSFHAAPIRNGAGELVAAVETFEDLTEIKRTEKKLLASENRYRILFEQSPAAMLVIDRDSGQIAGANEAAFTFYGYDRQEMIGKSITEIVVLPAEQVLRLLREIPPEAHLIQLQHRLKSGEIREVEVSRGPISLNGSTCMFSIVHDITNRKAAEDAAREGESKLAAIASLAYDSIILIDDHGAIRYWNNAAESMFGYTGEEIIGKNVETIMPARFRQAHNRAFARFVQTGPGTTIGRVYEVSALHRDGSEIPVELSISGLLLKGKWHAAGVVRDITGRRNLENQLRQAQKMEAIGNLAGGVAHDFNNMLTVIIGHATMLSLKMAEEESLAPHVQEILATAGRATDLTGSLLAFSRKAPLETRTLDLNDIIGKIVKLLTRLVREDIEVRTVLTEESVTIMADPTQMEQVLMNLVTNARDAMPGGGVITISTEVVELDREFIRINGYGTIGRYACLTCSDGGIGMDSETVQRIFEPFFTTKEIGRGTGLGLAIVYGIIKQHNGFINCCSEPGRGTTFRIHLPLVQVAAAEQAQVADPSPVGGSEIILIAEDDITTRNLTRMILENFGYTVIESEDGEDAVRQFAGHREAIDLVILDVVMPKKDGREACKEILALRPDMKCLFTSGYAENILAGNMEKEMFFIPKPIIPSLFLRKIRQILDEKKTNGG